jgi:hypothetical protein
MTEARDLPEHATTVERGGSARSLRVRPAVKQGQNCAPWKAPVSQADRIVGAIAQAIAKPEDVCSARLQALRWARGRRPVGRVDRLYAVLVS